MTLPGAHALDHRLRDQPRRRPSGDQRGRDDDVDVLGLFGVDLGGAAVVILGSLLRVAVTACLLLVDLDGEEFGAHRTHLFADLGPRIGSPHDRPEAAGGADRGQAGDARARDEHLRRRYLSGGGDLAGEEPSERVGGLDDCAIAGDVGHRTEHVERLGPRDAGHRIHRQGRDREAGQRVDKLGIQRRAHETDDHGAGGHAGDFLERGSIDGEDHVGGPYLVGRAQCRSGGRERVVTKTRPVARAPFDDDVVTEPDQLADRGRRRRDSGLTGLRLAADSDEHRGTPIVRRAILPHECRSRSLRGWSPGRHRSTPGLDVRRWSGSRNLNRRGGARRRNCAVPHLGSSRRRGSRR